MEILSLAGLAYLILSEAVSTIVLVFNLKTLEYFVSTLREFVRAGLIKRNEHLILEIEVIIWVFIVILNLEMLFGLLL